MKHKQHVQRSYPVLSNNRSGRRLPPTPRTPSKIFINSAPNDLSKSYDVLGSNKRVVYNDINEESSVSISMPPMSFEQAVIMGHGIRNLPPPPPPNAVSNGFHSKTTSQQWQNSYCYNQRSPPAATDSAEEGSDDEDDDDWC